LPYFLSNKKNKQIHIFISSSLWNPLFLLLFFLHIIGHLTGYIVNGGLGPLLKGICGLPFAAQQKAGGTRM
jgi:hypothetical protein